MTSRALRATATRCPMAGCAALLAVLLCDKGLVPGGELRGGDRAWFNRVGLPSHRATDDRSAAAFVMFVAPAASASPAAAERPGTLFVWSSDPGATGGPDLSEPIVTDRPDFTEASSTVGRGVVQIESGYTYTTDGSGPGRARSHSYPELLLRYGVWRDWCEARIAWNCANHDSRATHAAGSEDLYLGFKLGLTPQAGLLPEMAIVPQMTVPTGASEFTAGEVLPGLNWLYGWDVNDFLSIGGSTQFNRAVDGGTGSAYTEWAQSLTAGYSLTERLGAYTEWFALFPHSADTNRPEHYCNGGFTYLVTDDIQWDIRAGAGLNGAADDFFAGVGLSIRFR